jgi:chemotaxis protein MotB
MDRSAAKGGSLMSVGEDVPREIIIIRRGGGDDNATHKGGTWKIAYADFVTAMMAFFLVMWLINSANEATKARVASYFNPIKMNDSHPSDRGLSADATVKSQAKKEKSEASAPGNAGANQEGNNAVKERLAREDAMMADPYKALDKLAEEGTGAPSGRTVEIVTKKSGDPFDPMVWEALKKGSEDRRQIDGAINEREETEPGEQLEPGDAEEAGNHTEDAGKKTAAQKGKQETGQQAESESGREQQSGEKPRQETKQDGELEQAPASKNAISPEQSRKLAETAKEIKENLDLLKSADSRLGGLNFSVKVTSEGILVALSDSDAVSMFRIGSAEPNPALVSFIGKIGQLLQRQKGKVIVRGYTDGRRFLSNKFDNWQLSTARAHMASYMLMRGGLAESRLQKIEGYGETQLLKPEDPLSGVNRRVEMVLVPEP